MAADSGESPSNAKRLKKGDCCCCSGGGPGAAAVVRHQVMQGKRGNAVPCIFELHPRYEGPMKAIGRGAYGVVCCAHDTASGGQKVAIKKIANAFDNALDARRTLREIRLLRLLRHDNVIRVRDVLRPPNRTSFNDVYIVYDLMDTDLHHIIRSPQPLTDDHCQYFIYQLLRGLKYIHSANVLHRDLKPSNLLLNANCDLKICDFGLARVVGGGVAAGPSSSADERKSSQTSGTGTGAGASSDGSPKPCGALMTEYVVTRWYRAPELLLSCEEYSSAIDVWSVGCIFAELLGRKPIFPGKDYLHQLKLILGTLGSEHVLGSLDDADDGGILRTVSQKARAFLEAQPRTPRASLAELYPQANSLALNLLDKMLVFDPAKRITVSDALQHPYLAALHDPALEPTAPPSLHRLLLVLDQDDRPHTNKDEDAIREKVWQEMLHYHRRDHHDCGSVHFLRHKTSAGRRDVDVRENLSQPDAVDEPVSVSSSCRDEDDEDEDDEHDLYNDALDDDDEDDIDDYGEHDEQQLLPDDPGDAVTEVDSSSAAAGDQSPTTPTDQAPSSVSPSPSAAQHCLPRSSAAPPTPS